MRSTFRILFYPKKGAPLKNGKLLFHRIGIFRYLNKYCSKQTGGRLLPVSSNQKVNEYLKELAAICGIKKELTYHMARYTFATTIALHSIALKYKSL